MTFPYTSKAHHISYILETRQIKSESAQTVHLFSHALHLTET